MKKLMIVMISGSLALTGACKNKEKAATAAADSKTATAGAEKKEMYRFVVSFFSPGNGTDGEAIRKLDDFLATHAKKPKADQIRWGREGEVDYCFKLKEFSTGEQKKFIEEVQKLIGSSERVRFSENIERVKK